MSDKTDMGSCEEGESMLEEEAEVCDSLSPQMHEMMLAEHRRSSCCPQLFERASKSWWNPRFDSDILEQQYTESSLPKLTIRFRYALSYAFLSDFIWSIYWLSTDTDLWATCVLTSVCIAFLILILLVYSHHKHYQKHQFLLSCVACLLLMVTSLLPFGIYISKSYRSIIPTTTLLVDLSAPTIFTFYIEVLLLVYTVVPLPMYLAVTLCTLYSIVFETLITVLLKDYQLLIVRILLHISIHLIGAHIMIMNEVRMRGTFMSVGQSLLVRRQFEIEKALKEKMILSVMPPKVAHWLIEKALSEDVDDYATFSEDGAITRKVSSPRPSNAGDSNLHGESFRPFNMNVMDNVSILFADIVGFTRMSSNKTAEHLVDLLNDLFGRFDELCARNGCEKINTLGDCYYAVSGCPEPRSDHAECCVNMGLDMVTAIMQFDDDTNEDVNMRVGVHTGKVLCGIVGTMRFKFDVWSRDVTFANQMESTGKPGQVHITDVTRHFLPRDSYVIEEGPLIQAPGSKGQVVKEHKTYFISARIKNGEPQWPQKRTSLITSPNKLPPVASNLSADICSRNDLELPIPVGGPELKSSSLPNMVDSLGSKASAAESSEGIEADPAKARYTISTNRDLLKFKLPKMSRPTDKAKTKTISLPKITTSKTDSNSEKVGGMEREGRELASSNGSGVTHSTLTEKGLPLGSSSTPPSPVAPPPTPRGAEDDHHHHHRLTVEGKDPRKDSGIRTGSRRSSIQEQIFAMNGLNTGELLVNRVSDYFTASRSTISDTKYDNTEVHTPTSTSGKATLNECKKKFSQMRKQSDIQMIKCVQQERRSYMLVSPLCPVSLFFVDAELEKKYRLRVHQPRKDEGRSLASTLYNTYFDILVTALVCFCISISLLLLFGASPQWLVLFIVSTCWHLFILVLCLYRVTTFPSSAEDDGVEADYSKLGRLYERLTQWRAWHLCGASLLCLPAVIVFACFSCDNVMERNSSMRYFCYVAAVSLIHFCNFTQLNWWMKNILAFFVAGIFLALVAPPLCNCPFVSMATANNDVTASLLSGEGVQQPPLNISTSTSSLVYLRDDPSLLLMENATIASVTPSSTSEETIFPSSPSIDLSDHWFHVEVIIAYTMLLILVWLLNREFEISYRLSYYGYIMAVKDKMKVQNMKNQAEWLLHNIIPQHVANIIKTTAKYSKNHHEVGVMFASVINFNELYNEDYSSGKEYLRFLNELVADFDELLRQKQFQNVEKIKTIGSTYMASSGLNPQLRMANAHQYQHVCDLVDFGREMFRVLDNFNQNMIGFKFILRIGLNCGDVTAGVIGTTKLFYDIWGDAVNIASRMDSTGVPNRIQVTGECAKILRPLYKMDHRGNVFVKGKGNMDVFLLNFNRQSPTKEEEKER